MFNRYRIFAAYIFAIPLALMLGMLVTSPDELSFLIIAVLLFFLAFPLFIRWHHVLLIVFWNANLSAFFLPGQPSIWLMLAVLSFGISFLNRMIGQKPFIPVSQITKPLLALLAVIVLTAWYRGGIGFKALGGAANGGKHYVYIIGAMMGFYAFTGVRIPLAKSRNITALFLGSGCCAVLGNIVYTLGPAFYFMYYLIPSDLAGDQAKTEFGITNIDRIIGLGPTCVAVLCVLLSLYGIKGIFNLAKPWRLILFVATLVAAFFSGFRAEILFLGLILLLQVYFENLFKTRLFALLCVFALMILGLTVLFADKLPLTAQRALSFLPLHLDVSVRASAASSNEWRWNLWSIVGKDIPKYLLIGKGYFIDATEMYLTKEAIRQGTLGSYEESILAGDYHNGPLSVLMPFGLFGLAAFCWLLAAGFRVMYFNYLYGDEKLNRVNTVLLSYYTASCLAFFLIFGALDSQLYTFLGMIGISVSLNSGVKGKILSTADVGRLSSAKAFAVEAI